MILVRGSQIVGDGAEKISAHFFFFRFRQKPFPFGWYLHLLFHMGGGSAGDKENGEHADKSNRIICQCEV